MRIGKRVRTLGPFLVGLLLLAGCSRSFGRIPGPAPSADHGVAAPSEDRGPMVGLPDAGPRPDLGPFVVRFGFPDRFDGAELVLLPDVVWLTQVEVDREGPVDHLGAIFGERLARAQLGLYRNGSGGPTTLLAQTDVFDPVAGVNEPLPLIPVTVPAGFYWIGVLLESEADLTADFGRSARTRVVERPFADGLPPQLERATTLSEELATNVYVGIRR